MHAESLSVAPSFQIYAARLTRPIVTLANMRGDFRPFMTVVVMAITATPIRVSGAFHVAFIAIMRAVSTLTTRFINNK